MQRRGIVIMAALAWGTLSGDVYAFTVATTSAACTTNGEASVGRVRPRDGVAEYLVQQGRTRSGTFSGLLDALESSDVVVYMDVEPGSALGPSGRLQFVTARGGLRYVHVAVRPGSTSWNVILTRHMELVAILGHELQHAAEVAAAPDVLDASALAVLYRHVGLRLDDQTFDTEAARRAGTQILAELRDGGEPLHRVDVARGQRSRDGSCVEGGDGSPLTRD